MVVASPDARTLPGLLRRVGGLRRHPLLPKRRLLHVYAVLVDRGRPRLLDLLPQCWLAELAESDQPSYAAAGPVADHSMDRPTNRVADGPTANPATDQPADRPTNPVADQLTTNTATYPTADPTANNRRANDRAADANPADEQCADERRADHTSSHSCVQLSCWCGSVPPPGRALLRVHPWHHRLRGRAP